MSKQNHATFYRLGSRLNWNVLHSSKNLTHGYLFIKLLYMHQNMHRFLQHFDLSFDQILCFKNSKTVKQSFQIVPLDGLKNSIPTQKNMNAFYMKNNQAIPKTPDLDFEIFNISTLTNKSDSSIDGYFHWISASIFCNFITDQINRSTEQRDILFDRSFLYGLSLLIRKYMIFYRLHGSSRLNGIRILCAGKFSRTKSSRKQKMLVSVGKTDKQTISTVIDFALAFSNTKHGSFSVKI
jgi:hypothetical protein